MSAPLKDVAEPFGHFAHVPSDVAPSTRPKVPELQLLQVTDLVESAKYPFEHLVQEEAPKDDDIVPFGQARQSPAFLEPVLGL